MTSRARTQGAPPRGLALGLAAIVLAFAGALAPASAPTALAAGDGLDLATAATYTLAPAAHAVHVVVDVTATNNKPDVTTARGTTRFFYASARLAVQAEATAVRATSAGRRLPVTTTAADGYRVVEVRFASALYFHDRATVRVAFDLPGGAPRSASDIRVGRAFATFVAWAFGDRGSVRVVVPVGFEAETTGSSVTRTTTKSATVFAASDIGDIAAWYLVVNADRKSELTSARIDLTGGEHLVIRAWPEDAAWSRHVASLLTDGLPKLVELTGLDWPVASDLTIFEVHTPLLEGYAGVFFQGQDRIEISEDLDDLTIIHEASHAWFNTDLFEGRWIDEGFADASAAQVLDAIGIHGMAPGHVDPRDDAAVALNAWRNPGRITDKATEAREAYGYNASWTVIRSLVAEIGTDGMRRVIQQAQARLIPYVGATQPETMAGPADWRRFLDLLDEFGGSKAADALFRRWVATPQDAALLDERAVARSAYQALAGRDWLVPPTVRVAMAEWSFYQAIARIAEANAILAKRDIIGSQAAGLGVTVPAGLRSAYETDETSLDNAAAIADEQVASLAAISAASSAVAAPRTPLVALGLLGTSPETSLAAAKSAFSSGAADAADASAQATALTALLAGAADVGRSRLIAAVLFAAIVAFALLMVLVVARRRRRRGIVGHGLALAAATPDGRLDDPAAPLPYATLADRPIDPAGSAPIAPGPPSGDPSPGPSDVPADPATDDRGDAP